MANKSITYWCCECSYRRNNNNTVSTCAKDARGIEFGASDVALNLGFAFGAGFGLSTIADGARGAFRIARSAQFKTDKDVLTEVEKIKSPLDEGTVSTDVDLVGAKTILGANRRTGTAEATDTNLLKNTNLSNIQKHLLLLEMTE